MTGSSIKCLAFFQQEVEELRKLLDRDTSQTDIKDIWKGQLTDCIRELQDENEAQLNATKADLQANYDMQVQSITSSMHICTISVTMT